MTPREERGAPELLSLKETATLLGLSERSVRRLLDERRIPYYQVTDYTRKVDRADALAYLEQRRRAA